jgi:hypothetical protein
MKLPQRTHTDSNSSYDSARWDGFTHRRGDIIVVTPIKRGTTWTQMVWALLVHQSPELPEPLTRHAPR